MTSTTNFNKNHITTPPASPTNATTIPGSLLNNATISSSNSNSNCSVDSNSVTKARLTSKELPTAAWRRERRLRAGEYHTHHHNLNSTGSSTSSVRASSTPGSSPPPPPTAHSQQHSPTSVATITSSSQILHTVQSSPTNAQQMSMMMAAAAASAMRPLCDTTGNRNSTTSTTPPPDLHAQQPVGGALHLSHLRHCQAFHQHMPEDPPNEDSPLDMSLSSSLKQRNSPPPPYREPLPGSTFATTLARPSVITQAPPKREIRENTLITNREHDNRSTESIDEHFRRSLGNDYFILFAKKSPATQQYNTPSPQPSQTQTTPSALVHSTGTPPPPPPPQVTATLSAYTSTTAPPVHHQQQPQPLISPKPNAMLLSPAGIVAQMQAVNQNPQGSPLALQKIPGTLASPQSPATNVNNNNAGDATKNATSPLSSTTGSRNASPLPMPHTIPLTRLNSVENSPTSSPRHTPPVAQSALNNSPTLPAIMRIKTEPGLQNVKNHITTPPASPTNATTIPGSLLNNATVSSSNSNSNCSVSSSTTSLNKTSSNSGSTSAEVLASVDDHFAKALGDTWKKLQESKEMRK
uniref:Transcription cofactor vestigial-like protein 4 n=1 Tax=Glossina brevipalpis TaxID=37001 RepID=A0A1A9WRP0_9MUSC